MGHLEESEQVHEQQCQLEPALEADSEEPELVVSQLLQSVSEVQSDYQALRRELVEVQALQRELSERLRSTLAIVHGRNYDHRID